MSSFHHHQPPSSSPSTSTTLSISHRHVSGGGGGCEDRSSSSGNTGCSTSDQQHLSSSTSQAPPSSSSSCSSSSSSTSPLDFFARARMKFWIVAIKMLSYQELKRQFLTSRRFQYAVIFGLILVLIVISLIHSVTSLSFFSSQGDDDDDDDTLNFLLRGGSGHINSHKDDDDGDDSKHNSRNSNSDYNNNNNGPYIDRSLFTRRQHDLDFPSDLTLEERLRRLPESVHRRRAEGRRKISEPLKCKTSSSLETSPTLLEDYGSIEDGDWCEMQTVPVQNVFKLADSTASAALHSSSRHRQKEKSSSFLPGSNIFSSSSATAASSPSSSFRSAFSTTTGSTSSFSNGSTFFDYRASADGKNWQYYQCPIRHRIHCNRFTPEYKMKMKKQTPASNNRKSNKKTVTSRALVIYILTSSSNPQQNHHEKSNLLFFLKHGLIPAGTPTALYDEVDYVFAKVQLNNECTKAKFVSCGDFEEAAELKKNSLSDALRLKDNKNKKNNNDQKQDDIEYRAPNITFMLVPKVPCDLCAHARILDHLGVYSLRDELQRIEEAEEEDAENQQSTASASFSSSLSKFFRRRFSGGGREYNYGKVDVEFMFENSKYDETQKRSERTQYYSQIVMMNNGIRGPFFNSENDDYDDEGNDDLQQQQQQQHPRTTWVDFVSMGGRRRIPDPRAGFFHHKVERLHNLARDYLLGVRKEAPEIYKMLLKSSLRKWKQDKSSATASGSKRRRGSPFSMMSMMSQNIQKTGTSVNADDDFYLQEKDPALKVILTTTARRDERQASSSTIQKLEKRSDGYNDDTDVDQDDDDDDDENNENQEHRDDDDSSEKSSPAGKKDPSKKKSTKKRSDRRRRSHHHYHRHDLDSWIKDRKLRAQVRQVRSQIRLLQQQQPHHDCPLHVSTSATISWEFAPHQQTFFLSVPSEIMRLRLFSIFSGTCAGVNADFPVTEAIKRRCITNGELATGTTLLDFGYPFALYSLSTQMFLQNTSLDNFIKRRQYYIPDVFLLRNPTSNWADPCKSIFVKNGGQIFLSSSLHPDVATAVDRLTMGMMMTSAAATSTNHHHHQKQVIYPNPLLHQGATHQNSSLTPSSSSLSSSSSTSKIALKAITPEDFPAIQQMLENNGCEWNF